MATIDEELEFILDRVRRHDDSRGDYLMLAEQWLEMWKGNAGFVSTREAAIKQGREQITLPIPFNVVNLAQRLLSSTPRIDVIPGEMGNKESENYASECEKWLMALWKRVALQYGRSPLAEATWNCLVLGRFAFEVKWVKDKLPGLEKKRGLPISIRSLDPRNVGVMQGPLYTEFAYHRYETSILEVLRSWPELRESAVDSQLANMIDQLDRNNQKTEDWNVMVIDYWHTDPETGKIWNGIIVEDEWAKPFEVTTYPAIPIIVGRGDYGVGIGDEYDGLSILHSLNGLYQYLCRNLSQMATGMLWHFWPAITIKSTSGGVIDDIVIAPGKTTALPSDAVVDIVRIDPNIPLAQTVYDFVNSQVQQSTFPEVMWGQAPADIKTGYAVALLSDSAIGRIKNFQESLESVITQVNSLVLALVEKKGGKEGVDIYMVSERNKDKYKLNLNKKMINGNYDNVVHITPAMPQDDAGRVVMGKQLADSKYISAQTFRDQYLGDKAAEDETRRLAFEELMQSDEMRKFRLSRAGELAFEDDILDIFYETDFMPPPPEGMNWGKDDNGKVIAIAAGPEQPPGGISDMAMPPDMGMPPMDGGMGGPPMPPGGPPLQPDATLAGPMGGGFPPHMNGQMEGENLGMPQDLDPLIFDAMMNTPASPDEQMNLAAGLPPGGPI